MYNHIPVLLQEALKFLDPKPEENFVDATLGGGGYSRVLLEKVAPKGKVLSIDLDKEAVRNYELRIKNYKFRDQSIAVHGNFRIWIKLLSTINFLT